MKKLLLVLSLYSFTCEIFSQDLMILNNYSIYECTTDRASFSKDFIKYKIYNSLIIDSINVNNILCIKDYLGNVIYPNHVIVVPNSKLIHLPNANHIINLSNKIVYDSISKAIGDGYTLCAACFNNDIFLPDNFIEKRISSAINSKFRYDHEILYEDQRLIQLQKTLENIINKLPWITKGYNYRILIYRGEPNALAIPGGNIYLSNELLNLIETDDELEAILVHEIIHIENRHGLLQYYLNQKNELIKLFSGILAGTIVSLAGASDASYSILRVAETFTSLAISITNAGYNRELEQEADIMTQLFLVSQKKSLSGFLSILDKLAYYSLIRGSLTDASEVYGSHPLLTSRIFQVRESILDSINNPSHIYARIQHSKDHRQNIAKVVFDMVYLIPSSIKNTNSELLVKGKCENLTPNTSLLFQNFILRLPGFNKSVTFTSKPDLFINGKTYREFVISSTLPDNEAKSIYELIKNGKDIDVVMDISYLSHDNQLNNSKEESNFVKIPNDILLFEIQH